MGDDFLFFSVENVVCFVVDYFSSSSSIHRHFPREICVWATRRHRQSTTRKAERTNTSAEVTSRVWATTRDKCMKEKNHVNSLAHSSRSESSVGFSYDFSLIFRRKIRTEFPQAWVFPTIHSKLSSIIRNANSESETFDGPGTLKRDRNFVRQWTEGGVCLISLFRQF